MAKIPKENKFKIQKRAKFDTSWLPVIQNLSGLGLNESDIGVILGYVGKNPRDWLNNLKKNHPEVKDAWELGRQIADVQLVTKAFLAATGYDYVQKKTKLKPVTKYDGDGKEYTKWIEAEREEIQKHVKADPAVLKFLLCNRLPEFFSETKKLEIDQRTISLKGEDISKEIRAFAGRLLDVADRKEIDAEFVDKETVENGDSKFNRA